MNGSLSSIPLLRLALAFLPALAVIALLFRWSAGSGKALYAMARMLLQLLLVGYALTFIFQTDDSRVVLTVLAIMLPVASWIALNPLRNQGKGMLLKALAAIGLGGLTTLLVVTQGVLVLTPWHAARFVIPLAGMIFASAMNSVSLAGERYEAETDKGLEHVQARRIAFRASLIPSINALFAVGVVSIPGMMTGQILSGEPPLLAARYQIMVMCMIFGSGGMAAAIFLTLLGRSGGTGEQLKSS